MKAKIRVSLIGLGLLFTSCCPFINANQLGNNFILSEYDNKDRRILYSEDKCSGSGIEIVPMTVLEYANNSRWIIAKSTGTPTKTDYQYWIIDKDFKVRIVQDNDSTINIIKSHVAGPLDSASFMQQLHTNKIDLKLKKFKNFR
jgi:hypothetical protein